MCAAKTNSKAKSAKFMIVYLIFGLSSVGCTVMPGLHVDENEHSGYSIQQDPKSGGLLVTDPASGFSYRLVNVNASTIGEVEKTNSTVLVPTELGSITPASVPSEYKLGPGDIVNVIVWDHPELTNATGEYRDAISAGRLISTTGELFYPYVGAFHAEGMTVAQAREFIASGLSKVIKDPQVDVRIVSFRSRRVQVTGAVKSPGIVNLDDTSKGILDAISERGGLAENASRRRVELIRGGKTFQLAEGELVAGHSPILNPPIRPGDIINIPDRSSDQVFVLGAVGLQGAVYLQETNSTLTEALAESKGLDSLRADDSGVLVFRQARQGDVPSVYVFNMASPVGLLLAGEFTLKSRDVVYVKATDFAKYNAVINQLLPTITAVYQLDRL